MKEYTIIYTVEITEVLKTDEPFENYIYDSENAIANWVGSKLNVDDVHVKDLKVFPGEVTE